MGVIAAPELLAQHHEVQSFDCGNPSLNDWLKKKSLKAQQIGGSARTYVVCTASHQVIGYVALATGSVRREDTPGKVKRNMPDLIPVVLIGRLAVDLAFTDQGIGAGLLRDALLRILGAAEEIGIRAVLVHAIDDAARNFYLKQGFYVSPTDDQTLMITINDIQAAMVA